MNNALTESIDVAQVVLYAFWVFFAGLIYWLRKEDRREGYPLESDNPRRVNPPNMLMPPTKRFFRMEGGFYDTPNMERDERPIQATRTSSSAGAPLEPTGDPMLAGVGPGSYAQRSDHPEVTREGLDAVVPMRVAAGFKVTAGPDPRGWDVVATDGKIAGKVKDIWVDRADNLARYLEVELTGDGAGTRLLPIPMLRLHEEPRQARVSAVKAEHFAQVPTLKEPDRVTLLEEERISAFYAAGRLYAEPRRIGPVV